MQKLKSEKGFTAIDGTIAVIIISIGITLISTLIYNTYVQVLSAHKNSMATYYAVQILEKVNKLDYYDIYLKQGETTSNSSILDVPIDDQYTITLNIQDYNKQAGNETKKDLIKIITVTVQYLDNNLNKNISIQTIKMNM